jgi:TatA/E family protein of Tat protein translocase
MPFNIQGPELILILIIALIVVGPGKLPDVGAALGKSIREFRKAAADVKDASSEATATPPAPAPAPAPPLKANELTMPPAASVAPETAPPTGEDAPASDTTGS